MPSPTDALTPAEELLLAVDGLETAASPREAATAANQLLVRVLAMEGNPALATTCDSVLALLSAGAWEAVRRCQDAELARFDALVAELARGAETAGYSGTVLSAAVSRERLHGYQLLAPLAPAMPKLGFEADKLVGADDLLRAALARPDGIAGELSVLLEAVPPHVRLRHWWLFPGNDLSDPPHEAGDQALMALRAVGEWAGSRREDAGDGRWVMRLSADEVRALLSTEQGVQLAERLRDSLDLGALVESLDAEPITVADVWPAPPQRPKWMAQLRDAARQLAAQVHANIVGTAPQWVAHAAAGDASRAEVVATSAAALYAGAFDRVALITQVGLVYAGLRDDPERDGPPQPVVLVLPVPELDALAVGETSIPCDGAVAIGSFGPVDTLRLNDEAITFRDPTDAELSESETMAVALLACVQSGDTDTAYDFFERLLATLQVPLAEALYAALEGSPGFGDDAP